MRNYPSINYVKTASRIERIMKQNGYTVKALAEIFEMSEPGVYKWINGTGLPKIEHLVVLANLFNCKITDLIVIEG